MQKQHDTQIHNLKEMHKQELDMKEKELSRLARIIDNAFRWFPVFREMLRMEKFCAMQGFTKEMTESLLVKKEALKCSGKIYSEQHRRNFDIKDDILMIENDLDDESKLNLTINRKPIADWFREQWHRLRYGTRLPQQEEKKSRGFKDIIIKQEENTELPVICNLIEAAFANMQESDHQEHYLVDKLHKSDTYIPELSLVAKTDKGEVAGYILLTKVEIVSESEVHTSLAVFRK